MHRRLIVSLAVVAAIVAAPAPASASQTIARNATHVRLAVNKNRVALLTYRSEGRVHHTLAWGAINARTPKRGCETGSVQARLLGRLGVAPDTTSGAASRTRAARTRAPS